MRFLALATDYDGTLAEDGEVSAPTVGALQRLRDSGRKAILVTGRELPELLWIFPEVELFDVVVAENVALLYFPGERREEPLAEPPPVRFLRTLREHGVAPLSIGRAIIATTENQSAAILDTIHSLGLDLQVIFNKGSVMVLPSGVNKATGLEAALHHLGIPASQVVGVGDAENDHPLLRACGLGVAVANALPALKERADIVTRGRAMDGVMEVIEGMLTNDLAEVCPVR